jgi:imidazolonepropionase
MARGAAVAAAMATAAGTVPLGGEAQAAVETAGPSGVAWDDEGLFVYAGRADDLPWAPTLGDSAEGMLVPGFVDCHTHLPFIGWRADEFEARLRGVSYAALHGSEGGIYRSSRLFHEATDDEVLAFCRPLLAEMLAHGTTAVELKTGYGLTGEGELRELGVARRLRDEGAQTCTVTFLPCHAVPKGIDRDAWMDTVVTSLLPAASGEGIDAVDIYIEDIAFGVEDLERLAAAAGATPLRVHGDQLGDTGSAIAAARLGARSVDHLNHTSPQGVEALAAADTVAVLLPASTEFLGLAPAPAAALLAAAVPVALATDCNPGTSPVVSMPQAIAAAASVYRIPPLEALTAATLNAAHVLGLAGRLGTLEAGKRADLLLLDAPSFAQVPYRPGHNPVVEALVAGSVTGGAD